MKRLLLAVTILFCSLQTQAQSKKIDDPCTTVLEDPGLVLALKSARKTADDWFIGAFELDNRYEAKQVVLPGFWEGKEFLLHPYHSRVQSKTLTGEWVDLLLYGIVHFVREDSPMIVKAKSKVTFFTRLPPKRMADLSADEFRLLVTTGDAKDCIVSKSFLALPPREPIIGYGSK